MAILQEQKFDVNDHLAKMQIDDDCGALASFVGFVRASGTETAKTKKTLQKQEVAPIVGLYLEHYPGMTECMLDAVEQEARHRWPLKSSLIIHRYGYLLPGEAIVLTAAVSRHRKAALEAVAYMIDQLKTRALFWKREHMASGSVRWVEARAEDDEAAAAWQKQKE